MPNPLSLKISEGNLVCSMLELKLERDSQNPDLETLVSTVTKSIVYNLREENFGTSRWGKYSMSLSFDSNF
jgi:hypothetical protein